jgi:hypothetical protein
MPNPKFNDFNRCFIDGERDSIFQVAPRVNMSNARSGRLRQVQGGGSEGRDFQFRLGFSQ